METEDPYLYRHKRKKSFYFFEVYSKFLKPNSDLNIHLREIGCGCEDLLEGVTKWGSLKMDIQDLALKCDKEKKDIFHQRYFFLNKILSRVQLTLVQISIYFLANSLLV